ncbi:MAG: hypothetical protein LBU51_08190 [Bacteroidales bacterium]|jgi:hypothetical protein|nr:hypothetical protein [Bacteroidales bacterium]
MKKLWMVAVVCAFVFASCGNKAPKTEENQTCDQTEQKCCKEMTEEQKADCAAWKDWDNQTDEAKAQLVEKFKTCIDTKMAEAKKCCEAKKDGADKKECTEKKECPEKAAKCAEFKAKWDNWENLTIDEKKALIDQKMECCKAKCDKEKKGCCDKEKKGGCQEKK